jgi:hypothetical protein
MVALLLFLSALDASAKLCGDDVGGQDVPCDCGDTVVGDVSLNDDPVVSASCPSDGLIVRASEAADSVDIDLRGHTLRGSGAGVGVWILHGGPGGARVVSTNGPGTIQGFRDGLVANGSSGMALLDGIVVRDSSRDGVRLLGVTGATVRNTEAIDSGRDGFFVIGKSYLITDTRALFSQRFGYHLMGGNAEIGRPGAGNLAADSGGAGFAVAGMGHRVVDCVATGAGSHGVKLEGMHHEITGCIARENGENGVSGRGMDWRFNNNQALDNEKNGLVADGPGMVDAGSNVGSGNRGLGQRGPAKQCVIGRSECGLAGGADEPPGP